MCNCEIREEILFIIDDKETTLKWLETERKYLPVNNMYLKRIEKLKKDIEALKYRLSITPECDYECEHKKSANKIKAHLRVLDEEAKQEEKEHKQALKDIEEMKQQIVDLVDGIKLLKQEISKLKEKRNVVF